MILRINIAVVGLSVSTNPEARRPIRDPTQANILLREIIEPYSEGSELFSI